MCRFYIAREKIVWLAIALRQPPERLQRRRKRFAGMKAGEALRRVIVSDSWHG
jgi:hypothetical protein